MSRKVSVQLVLDSYTKQLFPLFCLLYYFINILCIWKCCSSVSPEELRNLGRCPLMPEEAALMLSALGYSRETYIYLAGSHIYGGHSRLLPFIRVYPNLVMKEDLLTTSELAPFRNFSSQVHTSMHLFHCHYQLLWFYLRGALI